MPSSLETLLAFVITFLLGVLWTWCLRYWRRCPQRNPHCPFAAL